LRVSPTLAISVEISDFAWDSQDNLYVAATTMNKVYKIRLTY